jgi:hypothetical protein
MTIQGPQEKHAARSAPWRLIFLSSVTIGFLLAIMVPVRVWLLMPRGLSGPLADTDLVIRSSIAIWLLTSTAAAIGLWAVWRMKGRRLNLRRARRFLRYLPAWSGLIGLLFGVWLGFSAGIWFHRKQLEDAERALYQIGAVQWYSSYARAVYEAANYRNGSEALRREINFLRDILEQADEDHRISIEYEIGLAYARLFALADANGDREAAEESWQKAAELLEGPHWEDVSKEAMLQRLERIDGQLPKPDTPEGSL